jgi:septum formation protein
MKIILASASPRRNEMLKNLNIPFEKIVAPAEEMGHEAMEKYSVEEIAVRNAYAKARGAADLISDSKEYIVIGADTIVVIDNVILGKPVDEEDARRMIGILAGRTHEVITSIALIKLPYNEVLTGYERTDVTFREISLEDINLYISTGEPLDKAGAYGIQKYGVFLVEKVNGDYHNVVGLPVLKLYKMMKEMGVDLFSIAVGSQL